MSTLSWDPRRFAAPPEVLASEPFEHDLTAVYFAGPAYRGKPTRVFAIHGRPPGVAPVPGMVLLHGGGGSACAGWVRRWVERGYAAISMDLCGCRSDGTHTPEPHEHGGPIGRDDSFRHVDDPLEDQWQYHAVTAAGLSHSLLRALPGVDPARIGLTGISWGGYLTCLVAAADPRFAFAAPVYGCGFLGHNSNWSAKIAELGEVGQRWLRLWDPSQYLAQVTMPMLWLNGTNDFAYPLDSMQMSYRLPSGPRTLSVPVRMDHGHPPGERPAEIAAFADHLFRGTPPLARLTGCGRDADQVWASFDATVPIQRAELNYTVDQGTWQERLWEIVPADWDAASGRATATLPAGVRVYYLNAIDERGLLVSSEHEELPRF